MVTSALCRFIEGNREATDRVDWFLEQSVQVLGGTSKLKDVCGFDRNSPGFDLAFEKGLAPEDRGPMAEEMFKKTYWGIRPDIRFWAHGGTLQLIIECKGRGPKERSDIGQARRCFSFLRDRQANGAVVYLVPVNPDDWLELVQKASGEGAGRFGAICWCDDFLQPFASELVEVIGESLVSTGDFLKKAIGLRRKGRV
jgi:hypothetical protein